MLVTQTVIIYQYFSQFKYINYMKIILILAPEPVVKEKVEVQNKVYIPPGQRNFQGK